MRHKSVSKETSDRKRYGVHHKRHKHVTKETDTLCQNIATECVTKEAGVLKETDKMHMKIFT